MKRLLLLCLLIPSLAQSAAVVEANKMVRSGTGYKAQGIPRKSVVPLATKDEVLFYYSGGGTWIRSVVKSSTGNYDSIAGDSFNINGYDGGTAHEHMAMRGDTVYWLGDSGATGQKYKDRTLTIDYRSASPTLVRVWGWETTCNVSTFPSGTPVGPSSSFLWTSRDGSTCDGSTSLIYKLSTDDGATFGNAGDVYAYNHEIRQICLSYNDGSDSVWAVVWDRAGTPHAYDAYYWGVGGSWSARDRFYTDTDAKSERGYSAESDRNGRKFVAWVDTITIGPHILCAIKSRDSANWHLDTLDTYSDSSHAAGMTATCVDMYSGNVWVFYTLKPAAGTSADSMCLYVRRFNPATWAWTDRVQVSPYGGVMGNSSGIAGSTPTPTGRGARVFCEYQGHTATGHGSYVSTVVDSTLTEWTAGTTATGVPNYRHGPGGIGLQHGPDGGAKRSHP